ncbi:hypothetical protein MTBBW1_2370001 [Desulfamplus magnetovallimortis]|uniref:Uncharacterized protein n=2 Tax=Desulfamplus magnetovallimortis TaxID=1246637 RepID=A0A1W1HE51_9BACT|nr:hypothetical protein MTBBW1_2370001 [Desulfamplus magnetovallimortis]
MDQAFKTIRNTMEAPLDILLYDACFMGSIEVAQLTSQVAQVMGASAEKVIDAGMDYNALLKGIEQNAIDNGIDFGKNALNAYIKECETSGKFEGTRAAVTYSVLDLTKMSVFEEQFQGFTSKLKGEMENNSYQLYSTLSKGLIRSVSYPLIGKTLHGWLDSYAEHLEVDIVNWMYYLSKEMPALEEQATNLIDTIMGYPTLDGNGLQGGLVVEYKGNVDNFSGVDSNAGRLSIDLGVNTDYIKNNEDPTIRYLPISYDALNDAIVSYYQSKESFDFFEIDSKYSCEDSTSCADYTWLLITSDNDGNDIVNTSAWLCGAEPEENSKQVLVVKSLHNGEVLYENTKFHIYQEDICKYSLCADGTCEWITVTENGNMLTASAMVNGISSILFFSENQDGTWEITDVNQYIHDTWMRGSNILTGDVIIPGQRYFIDDIPETKNSDTALIVMDTSSIHLQKVCEIDMPSVIASFYTYNGIEEYHSLCDSYEACFFGKEGEDTHPGVKIKLN